MTLITNGVAPLLTLPNELVVQIANHLKSPADAASLLLTNRRLSVLLDHVFDRFASHPWPKSDQHTLPPLVQAADHGHMGRARRLLRLGHKVDGVVRKYSGFSTFSGLSLAVRNKHTEVIHLLLDHDANIYIGHRGAAGDPLTIALKSAVQHMMSESSGGLTPTKVYDEIIRILLGHHFSGISNRAIVPPEAVQRWLKTAFTGCSDDVCYLQLLFNYGSRVEDLRMVFEAASHGYMAVTDLLMRHLAHPLRVWGVVWTAIKNAEARGDSDILLILLNIIKKSV